MNKFLLLLLVVVYVDCNGGLQGLIRSSIRGDNGYSNDDGYSSSSPYQKLYEQQLYQQQQPQYQQQQYQPQYLYKQQEQPQIVEVQNEETPVKVIFRARSPKIQVEQINVPGEKPTVQKTRSEEEPHLVQHEVHRPVIQEIREVIQPYRRVIQEIRPVLEQVQTVVARGEGRANNAQGNEGLLLSQALQLNNGNGNGNSGYGNSGYGSVAQSEYGSDIGYGNLAGLGLQLSKAPLWNNAKSLSRSRASS